jgi:hypothetical protein
VVYVPLLPSGLEADDFEFDLEKVEDEARAQPRSSPPAFFEHLEA